MCDSVPAGNQICKGQSHRKPGNNDWSIKNETASNLAGFWTIYIHSKTSEFRETFRLFYFSQKTNKRYKQAKTKLQPQRQLLSRWRCR